jgi:integrase/recombinase XerD
MSTHRSKDCRTLIRTHVAGYLRELAEHGYKESTREHYRVDLLRVIAYAEQTGIGSIQRFALRAGDLLPDVSECRWARRGLRSTVNRFVEYLVRHGIVRDHTADRPKTTYDRFAYEFVRFQTEYRGICPEYAKTVRRYCGCFFEYLERHNIRRLVALRPEAVLDFITEDGKTYTRKTMNSRCSVLRILLAYLYRRGAIRHDLSGIVVGPRMYRDETCPRFISRAQTEAILSQIDRSTPVGLRDYAMVLLLITYGLRGGEVIRLRLDDIDWRQDLLHIRARKAGNNTVYPLASSVAHTTIQYLRRARPHSEDRHVFLSVKAPYRPLAYTWALGDKVRQYMRRAGINVPRPGTHTFRYSCAQSLLGSGTPLKAISDYLGHRQPETTQQYLKIAVDDLRDVALPGEEVGL